MTDVARWSRLPDEPWEEYRDSFKIAERAGMFYVTCKDWSQHGVHMTCTSREAAEREITKLVDLYRDIQETATYALRVNNAFWNEPQTIFGTVGYPFAREPVTWKDREKVERIIDFFKRGPERPKVGHSPTWHCVRGGVNMVTAEYEIVRVSRHQRRAWDHD